MHSPFIINGTTFDLSHLNSFRRKSTIQLRNNLKEVAVEVSFSCHCWSRKPVKGEPIPPTHFVADGSYQNPRDRIFSEHRHGLSFALPEMINSMLSVRTMVHETQKKNIMRVDTVVPIIATQHEVEYYIFCKISKQEPEGQQKYIKLFVESAYQDSVMYEKPDLGKPIELAKLLGDCWELRYPR